MDTQPKKSLSVAEMPEEFGRFRRALRREDQLALDDLISAAQQHKAAAGIAPHLHPTEVFLLSMLLGEHKEVKRLRMQVEELIGNRW